MRDPATDGGGANMRRLSDLEAELSRIETMDADGLRAAWEAHFAVAPSAAMPARILRLALAYELQVKALGGLSAATERRLARFSQRAEAGPAGKRDSLHLKPGATLLRDWGGRTWRVEVEANRSFRFEGKSWRSLSAIARAITGTSRNGPAFFGLRGGGNDGSA